MYICQAVVKVYRAFLPLFLLVFCFSSDTLSAQACDCDEYLYLNETTNGGIVHKFLIDPNGSLTEINPTNGWYPNGNASELPIPHGLALDVNGFAYIGESINSDSDIRRLDCDGNISPASEFEIPDEPIFNSNSIGNTMFVNTSAGSHPYPYNVRTYNLCDASYSGNVCLELADGTPSSTLWGMYQDPITQDIFVFAEQGNGSIFRFNESDIGGACVTPIATDLNATGIISSLGEVQGLTLDPDGNIYLVNNDGWGTTPAQILKFDPNGSFVCSTGFDMVNGDGGWYGAVGIIYSPSCDCLYTSNFSFVDDCVSQFDLNCNYQGAAVDPTGTASNNVAAIFGKGISIRVECCPTNPNTTETIEICDAQLGNKFFLENYLPCDSICAGAWTEVSNTAGTFDPCDNSLTFQQPGDACYTYDYVPTGTNLNEICSEFHIEVCFNISSCCVGQAVAAFAFQPTCTNGVTNNDGFLQISAATHSTHYNFSIGNTYTGPTAIANATAFDPSTDLPLQFNTGLSNPSGSQDYTIRVFNGADDCYIDEIVTLQQENCTASCNCTEYIYLNEPGISAVLKFAVDPITGDLTEIANVDGATPWYPGNGTSELPSPHGAAFDSNGNLYIGSNNNLNQPIRKLGCDGTIAPIDNTTIYNEEQLTNMFSIGNTLYATGTGGPIAYDLCTGAYLGQMCLNDELGNPVTNPTGLYWGLTYNPDTDMVYTTSSRDTYQGIWAFSIAEFNAGIAGGPCIDQLVSDNTTSDYANLMIGDTGIPIDADQIGGVVGDSNGNIYLSGWLDDNTEQGFVLKYDGVGVLLAKSPLNATYKRSRGLILSTNEQYLYLANNINDNSVDCVSLFNPTDLSYLDAAVPNPNVPESTAAKAMTRTVECCPTATNLVIDTVFCNIAVDTEFNLNDLNQCDGVFCSSTGWVELPGSTGITYDACNTTVTIDNMMACGSFTYNGAAACGNFTITINFQTEQLTSPTIGGDLTICTGEDPPAFSIVTPASGSGTLTYKWQSSTTNCNDGFTDVTGATSINYNPPPLSQTTYYRIITNSNGGCTSGGCNLPSNCVTIEVDDLPQATTSSTDPTCGENNGTITFTFPDHPTRTNIQFSLDGGVTYPYDPSDAIGTFIVSNLAPGSFDLWTRWGNSECPVDLPDALLINIAGPSVNATDEEICIGETATISATATGGTAPYTYVWSNGLGSTATITASPTSTTTYMVTVTDATNCETIESALVTVNTNPPGEALNNGMLTCDVTEVNVIARPNAGTYSFAWTGPNGFTSTDRTPLVSDPGTYVVTITDTNTGCTDIQSTEVQQDITPPTLNAGAAQEICAGESASLTATGTGTFDWDNGLGAGATHSVSPTITTTYTVTATDASNGCTAVDQITVAVLDSPEATVSSTDPTCGENNGAITFTFPDNPNRTQLDFSVDGGITYPYNTTDNVGSFTASNLAPGTYDLWVRWGDDSCPVDLPEVTLVNQSGSAACFGISITRN